MVFNMTCTPCHWNTLETLPCGFIIIREIRDSRVYRNGKGIVDPQQVLGAGSQTGLNRSFEVWGAKPPSSLGIFSSCRCLLQLPHCSQQQKEPLAASIGVSSVNLLSQHPHPPEWLSFDLSPSPSLSIGVKSNFLSLYHFSFCVIMRRRWLPI